MSLKAKVEAIIYAAEEPITLEQIAALLKDLVLAELAAEQERAAMEQTDAAAESQAGVPTSTPIESVEMPGLAKSNGEELCPEAGPLMPGCTTSAEKFAQEQTADVSPESAAAVPGESPSPDQPKTPADQPEDTSGEYTAEVPEQEPVSASPQAEAAADAPSTSEATAELAPAESASVEAPESTSRKRQPRKSEKEIAEDKSVRTRLREILTELVADYASEDRGMEIRAVAGGFRMATKPEHHDVVRAFAKSLKPPIRLSLAALETLAVIAYKQPITGPEISDIRGVESAGVLGTLLDRKLITTAGRKQVIGRPMQYKTSKDFLLRFGLNDVNELPSMEEFSQLASDGTIEIESQPLFESQASRPAEQTEVASQATEVEEAEHTAPESESTNPGAPEAAIENSQSSEREHDSTPDNQPQAEAESNDVPETEHHIGR